jgi:hypothetical protein
MPRNVLVYIAVVILAACGAMVTADPFWPPSDPLRFFSYLLLAWIASTWKVKLPWIEGTYSLNFIFVLLGIIDLSLGETAIIGTTAGAIQCLWKPQKRPSSIQVAFNSANLAISAIVAHTAALAIRNVHAGVAITLAIGAFSYFVTNTVLVSGVISLLERRPLLDVWRHWHLWSFPYLFIGTGVVGVVSACAPSAGWQMSLLVLPMMYLVHCCYRLCLQRQAE